ncbi:MAG: acyl carrier protein [Desulfobacterales bacterium]|nr:acyl carrier protein [Desulfobacterales bacterium]
MDIQGEIKEILADILDIEEQEITPETYIIRELGAESIDLLELAVALNSRFHIEVKDDEIFLAGLRLYMTEAEEERRDVIPYLIERLPFLGKNRVKEIMGDLEGGPTLKVKDLISYVEWRSK